MLKTPIASSLSPNTEPDDVWIAITTLFSPWMWKKGTSTELVEDWFRDRFKTDTVYSFNSGRTALYAILKSCAIGPGDEVIVQAFTCVAVPEVVMWVGAKPLYVDIDDSYNIDPSKLEKLITKKTKAVIVQHTFGIPADIKKIRKICEKHSLILIEDCAHALGATVDGKLVGSFGDAAFFSFGRDKVVSSVFGGIAILSSKFKVQNEKLQTFHEKLSYPSFFWIKQQLLHPVMLNLFILPWYDSGIGKAVLVLFQKLKLLSFPIEKCEYTGNMPGGFLKKYPNGLAILALNQLKKLDRFNKRRISIARQYFRGLSLKGQSLQKGAIYLRYPLQLPSRNIIVKIARKEGILLGNWYHNVIDPADCYPLSVGYTMRSCPNAEKLADGIINLPTHPRMRDEEVDKVKNFVNRYSHPVTSSGDGS
ncbi:aminotransferase class I/II-fold pyridoxal phosphate-dependent enzyme [Candidatus Roizmanbacteria bacterium]|nr:aminotransferase class I/II-fold pyridoxal phosphate-dependent enzyme [Candidatus Roizmanbacteria bacterium]